jgi:hypothetical protein
MSLSSLIKRARLILLAVAALVAGSCAGTPIVGEFSPQAAQRQAQKDFAAGTPKIYLAGGIAAYEPGIGDSEKALVAKLPRDGDLAGCTNPHAPYAVSYATAYNREMVSLLRKSRSR